MNDLLPLADDDSAAMAVWRILDANLNRGGEALRVIEEFLRFALDDAHLSRLCKELRHDFFAVAAGIPTVNLLAARDTPADVGTQISTAAEFARADLSDVLAANFQRLVQSLRCLEEYGKISHPAAAAGFESLRYRAYTLQAAVVNSADSLARLAGARLYVLIDGRESESQCRSLAEALVAAGVDVLQLRDKRLDDRTLVARARAVRAATRGTGTLFVMNDRPDIAVVADADGVHVGQEEMSARDARRIVGPRRLVGVSTHDLGQARQAVLDGANYIGCGPTFPSTTKAFAAFAGLDFLRAVAAEICLPAFAIGGIDAGNLDQVLQTGFTRIAVSGAVCEAGDPAVNVARLLTMLSKPLTPDPLPAVPGRGEISWDRSQAIAGGQAVRRAIIS